MPTFSKKSFYIFALGLVAISALLLIIPMSAGIPNSNFLMVIDYGNGRQRKFIGNSRGAVSAWDSLQQATAHAYLKVDVGKNFYPEMIDFLINEKDGKQWVLYINKKKISESPINIKINDGDTVVWKFE